MQNRRNVLIGLTSVCSASLAGCTVLDDFSDRDGEDDGSSNDEDNVTNADEDDVDPVIEADTLKERTENVMSDIRWFNFRRGLDVSRYREPLMDISEDAQSIIDSGGAMESLDEIEETVDEWQSNISSRLLQMYPELNRPLEDIPDIVSDLNTAINAVSNPDTHQDVLSVTENLVDRADYYRSNQFMDRYASKNPITNITYSIIQSENALANDDVTPLFEIRHSRDGEGGFYAAAHPRGDEYDDISNGPFERSTRTENRDNPTERFEPFSNATEFEQEMTIAMGEYTGQETFENITNVAVQVQEHNSAEVANNTIDEIIEFVDGNIRTRVDFDSGTENETIDIVGFDWTVVEYEPGRYGGEKWMVALLADEEYVYILDPYPVEDGENENRRGNLDLCWISDEIN